MTDAIAALLQHNNPPPDLLVGDALREKLRDENRDLLKRCDDLLAAADRVPNIESDDVAGKVTDFIKQLTALAKAAETKRTDAKEPYLEGGRHVDGFFKAITDPVAKAKVAVEKNLTTYLRDKADRERREREEQERLAREAAEQARKGAEEKARAAANDLQLAAAIKAEEQANAARADLVKAEKAAEAKAAELSRTRGEYGSVSSLRTVFGFEDIDRATIDLEALRNHLPLDGLEKAVRSFIKAGGRELRGTRIYETTNAVVR
jgi:hypothetical protein